MDQRKFPSPAAAVTHSPSPPRTARRRTKWPRLVCIPLAIGSILAAGAVNAAGRVFFDDFESGNVSKWTPDGTRDVCQPVKSGADGSAPHGGQYMLECNWNGEVPWDAHDAYSTVSLPQAKWQYKGEFLLRLWIKYDQDVAHTEGGKVLRFFPPDHLGSVRSHRPDGT